MSCPCRIEFFGQLRCTVNNQVISKVRTRKTGVVLAYLALHPYRALSRDEVVGVVWPEADLPIGLCRLRQALMTLRRLLSLGDGAPEILLSDRSTVRFRPGLISTDVHDFESKLKAAAGINDMEAQRELLTSALALAQDDFLPGHTNDWIVRERERLTTVRTEAMIQLAKLHESAGNYESAISYARKALEQDCLLEEIHALLIRAYAASGNTPAALRQYHELGNLLYKNLGEQPSAATKLLIQQIKAQDVSSSHPKMELAKTTQKSFKNLPASLTRFFGHDTEIRQVRKAILNGRRFITLTGTGGSGKSRLALEIGRHITEQRNSPAWLVSMTEVSPEQGLYRFLLENTFQTTPNASPALDRIEKHLNLYTNPILILDNFDDHVEQGRYQVLELLERCPTLTCIVTSRKRLNLLGEQEVQVLPLPVPPDTTNASQFASVQLFIDRARACNVTLNLDESAFENICVLLAKLDGLPLAIELAASWARHLTLEQMIQRLGQNPDFLAARYKSIDKRHRSMREVVEQSMKPLSPELEEFFVLLSAFRDGWSQECCEEVCKNAKSTKHLEDLLERSLITAEDMQEGYVRYRMLGTSRSYATDKLDNKTRTTLLKRLAKHYIQLFQLHDLRTRTLKEQKLGARFSQELSNLVEILEWFKAHHLNTLGLELMNAVARFWTLHPNRRQGAEWLEYFVDQAKGLTPDQNFLAQHNLGKFHWILGTYNKANAAQMQALQIASERDDQIGMVEALCNLAAIAWSEERYSKMCTYARQALKIAKTCGYQLGEAKALYSLGAWHFEREQYQQANELLIQSHLLHEQLESPYDSVRCLLLVGTIKTIVGEYESAEKYFRQCRRKLKEPQSGTLYSHFQYYLSLYSAIVSARRAHYSKSVDFLISCLNNYKSSRTTPFFARMLSEAAQVVCRHGQYETAARILAGIETLSEDMQGTRTNLFRDMTPIVDAPYLIKQNLSEEAFRAAWDFAEECTVADLTSFALESLTPLKQSA